MKKSFLVKPYSSKGTTCRASKLYLDLSILSQILLEAEQTKHEKVRKNSSFLPETLSFGELLDAYRNVIKRHGIDWRKETHLYRFVLKLSMNTKRAWRQSFQ